MIDNQVIETGVDSMLRILEVSGKIELKELANQLNAKYSLVEEWVKFLVEEHIVAIEYKFTTPYVYMLKEEKDSISQPDTAYEKEVDYGYEERLTEVANKGRTTWEGQVQNVLTSKESFFYNEASRRELNKVDELWTEYKKRVLDGFKS